MRTSTTLFLPVGLGHATWCFKNRAEAFARGFDTAESGLAGYKNREDAIAAAARRHLREFGILHLTITPEVHEQLALAQQLNGTEVGVSSGAPLWTITSEGCELLAHPCKCEMTLETINASAPAACATEDEAAGESCSTAGGCCGNC